MRWVTWAATLWGPSRERVTFAGRRSCERLLDPPAPGRRREGDATVALRTRRGYQPPRARPERKRRGRDRPTAIHARDAQSVVARTARSRRRPSRDGDVEKVERVAHSAPPRQCESRGGENAQGPDEVQPRKYCQCRTEAAGKTGFSDANRAGPRGASSPAMDGVRTLQPRVGSSPAVTTDVATSVSFRL